MYKCQSCKCISSPKEAANKVVLETRPQEYSNKVNDKIKVTSGYEIVKEVMLCKNCVSKYER